MASVQSSTLQRPRGGLLAGLALLAFCASLLALFQWMELIVAHHGGRLSCSINAVFDCALVWNSDFAKSVQEYTKLPVAAWGLVWGIGAFAAVIRLSSRVADTIWTATDIHVVRIFAAAGVVSSIGLGIVSLRLGALCITCLLVYAIVLAFALISWQLPAPLAPKSHLVPALGMSALIFAIAFGMMFYPGSQTPTGGAMALENAVKPKVIDAPPDAPSEPPAPPKTLAEFVGQLPKELHQPLSDGIARIRASKARDTSKWPVRMVVGDEKAPAHLVKFTDIKCGHCARLMLELAELKKLLPPGSFTIESRQYPLDSDCNPELKKELTDGSKIRCASARALICLESKPEDFERVQTELFAEGQAQPLTEERVFSIAGPAYKSVADLKTCMGSPETKAKLLADIAYAKAYQIEGTPLVLINGREVEPIGGFLFAMILAKGDPDAPEFLALPKPSAQALLDDDHAGHSH